MRLLLLFLSFAVIVAGCDSAEFASYNFKLRTDRDAYGAADPVIVTLENETYHDAMHGLCNAELSTLVDATWEAVRRVRPPCVYSPTRIYPDEVLVDTLSLADWATQPGQTYRYGIGVGSGGTNFPVYSNRFIVR